MPHVRFVPGNIGSPRLNPWTVGQSVSELVTLPLLCESKINKSQCLTLTFDSQKAKSTESEFMHMVFVAICSQTQRIREINNDINFGRIVISTG